MIKILHLLTLDRGTGPTVIIKIEFEAEEFMLRIAATAVFGKTAEVDVSQTMAQIATIPMDAASQTLRPDLEPVVNAEIVRWLAAKGHHFINLRWKQNAARHFSNRQEIDEYDIQIASEPVQFQPEAPKRRRRLMME